MTDLNYTISDDYILNVSIGNGRHGGKYFCGKFDSKEECEVFYKNIKENKDKNICFETDKEGFELLSFIGLSGKYKVEDDKYFVCLGKYPLIIKSKGYISVGQLSKIIKVDNFELTSNVSYDKEFKAYNPTDNIFEKTNYAIAVGEITEKM
jgi:hypothetical protein